MLSMTIDNRKDITVSLPGDWVELIEEEELGYGDSMSGYCREAVREKLEREGLLEDDAADAETDGGEPVCAD